MTSASPTMLALETDSAWLVILAVSLVTFAAVVVVHRLIGRPGGLSSGIVLALPLLLPVLAAVVYQHAVLPEVSVLKPANPAVLRRSSDLLHLFWFSNGGRTITPYALSGSAGPWLLLFGASLSSFMLGRRALGHLSVRRLIHRCRPADPTESWATQVLTRLACDLGMKRTPELLVLPGRTVAAFTTGSRVVVSAELLACLDETEVEGILAHELAHIGARDVPLIVTAGILRDVVAWNPIAHIAFRRLAREREFEADRRAVVATGDPLAMASGLVKMCELLRGRRPGRIAALAFTRPGARVSRRVSNLLMMADGRAAMRPASWGPYLAATCLIAVLGLTAGARLADDGSALAFVWGGPTTPEGARVWDSDKPLWSPGAEISAEKGGLASRGATRSTHGKRQAKTRGRKADAARATRSGQLAEPTVMTVRQKDVPKFIRALQAAARRQGVQIKLQADQSWQAEPLVSGDGGSSFGIFTVERLR
jgi:Zn-dependent protease with chaperone function